MLSILKTIKSSKYHFCVKSKTRTGSSVNTKKGKSQIMHPSHFETLLREGSKIYLCKQNRTKGDTKFYTSMITQFEIHALYKKVEGTI